MRVGRGCLASTKTLHLRKGDILDENDDDTTDVFGYIFTRLWQTAL